MDFFLSVFRAVPDAIPDVFGGLMTRWKVKDIDGIEQVSTCVMGIGSIEGCGRCWGEA